MNAMEAVGLLNDINALAQDALCRPLGEPGERRERCEMLATRLAAAVDARGTGARFLENFAPLMVTAIDRALEHRKLRDDAGAEKWDSLIGFLIPAVRGDGCAALAWLQHVSREDERTGRG